MDDGALYLEFMGFPVFIGVFVTCMIKAVGAVIYTEF